MSAPGNDSSRVFERALKFGGLAMSGFDPDDLNASEVKRLALFAYLFGAANGAGKQGALSPPKVHAVSLAMFQEFFEMSAAESARVSQWCIDQTDARSPWNPIVHAGLEAYLRWSSGELPNPAEDLKSYIQSSV